MSVTVVSCVYGDFERFEPDWQDAINQLDPAPDDVIVASVNSWSHPWRHTQAWALQQAIDQVETEWFWICDMDDQVMSDGLDGLDEIAADVWQLGFLRSDGELYCPPRMSAAQYLASGKNVYVGASMIRTEAFRAVGGYDDIAFQDWGLWRKLARAGTTFEFSDRAHFHYQLHDRTRSETEFTAAARADQFAEMMEAERAYA